MASTIHNPASKGNCVPVKTDGKKSCCMHLKTPPDKPDPAIYSQQELIQQGLQPTWNNPDIITNHWNAWTLDTEPQATIRNLSGTAGAINVQVLFYYAQFGIGFNKILSTSTLLNLPAGDEQTLKFSLPPSVLAGPPFISSWVNIIHSADKRLSNNEGLQTVYGAHASIEGRSPVFSFPLFNNATVPKSVSLVIYGNELGASISSSLVQLAPFEQRMITLHLHVPPGMHGAPTDNVFKEVTIAAFAQGQLFGGLTYIIKIDN